MMGYVRKDFLLMRKQMRTYGVILLVYGAISAAGVWESYILSGFVVLVTLMCPLSAMAFDQVSRWDSYACTLPGGARNAVRGRYVYTAVIALGSVLICGALCLLIHAFGLLSDDPLEMVAATVTTGLVSLLMASITLPLCYRFGVERGRTLMTLVFVVAFVAIVGIAGFLFPAIGAEERLQESAAALAVGLILVTVAAYFISCRISQRIYAQKEW